MVRQREVILLFVTTEEEEMGEGPIRSLSPGYCDHCDHVLICNLRQSYESELILRRTEGRNTQEDRRENIKERCF